MCPHCGCVGEDHVTPIKGARGRPSKAHPEGKEHKGLYQCNFCRQQFTVTVKTVFERSKVPLNKWLAATFMMISSKKVSLPIRSTALLASPTRLLGS